MNYMYVPEKVCAEMHAKLLTLVISGVREVRTSVFFKPQECIHKCVIF